jgi:hypothetical protein
MVIVPFDLEMEDELLILLLQSYPAPGIGIKVKSLIKEVDWEYLLNKAYYHGLRPLLYSNLRKYSNNVPEDIMHLLKDYYFINSRKNLLFMGELIRLVQIFETRNINLIPYKGPILAIQSYNDLSIREFGDIDLFINKKDFPLVKKILILENYETILNLSNSKEVEYMKYQRECKFKNTNNGIPIEIQWNVTGFSFSFPNSRYFPINNLKSLSVNNHKIKTFTNEDLILILSIHVAGHMWSRLSWMCDLVELINKSDKIDWNQIMKKAHDLAIERILYLNLSLSQNLFDLKLPKNVQEYIENDNKIEILEKNVLEMMFNPQKVGLWNKLKLRFHMRENKINGVKDIWRILTIPRSDEWSSFEKKIPIKILYTFKRPLQILKRIKD